MQKNQGKYLHREITLTRKLSEFRFFIKYFDGFELGNSKYGIVLELAENSLDKIIPTNGFSELKAFFFFCQIVHGIEWMHNEKIVHRDIKPENVLIKDYMVKICDFTTARTVKDDDIFTFVGTPGNCSPQMLNKDIQNVHFVKANDVYSLGITLYQLVFKKQPYTLPNNSLNQDVDINYYHECIDYPKKISKEFKELFLQLIESEADKRLKIEEIRSSNWYKNNKALLENIYPESKKLLFPNFKNFKDCYIKIDN